MPGLTENKLITNLLETEAYVRSKTAAMPRVGLILGSGLGDLMESSKEDAVFFYNELPHFVVSTVSGHAGKLIMGELGGSPIVVMQGRLHYYEGYSMQEITYPIRLMKRLGVEYLVITASSGAINPVYKLCDIVFIKDHINMMGVNPLRGHYFAEFGERFCDMSQVYDKGLRKLAVASSKKLSIIPREGVYMSLPGPSYETPAEIKAFRKFGGDVVGMSVVPEAIVANQMGMKILGISYVANKATAPSAKPLTHDDVLEAGKKVNKKFGKLILQILSDINYKIKGAP
jgi:purine-nucleoside phosphorylase